MAQHNDTGKLGETLAQRYLIENGYAILDTNWRLGKVEADIIAYREGMVVFVEVKTRTTPDYGEPIDSVTRTKQRAYIRLANAYMLRRNRDEEVRFDIIGIYIVGAGYRIEHETDAFSAVDVFLR